MTHPKPNPFTGLQDEIPRFPMLSRIAGPCDRALYSGSDLAALKLECQNASALIQDTAARKAVEKILLAADCGECLHSDYWCRIRLRNPWTRREFSAVPILDVWAPISITAALIPPALAFALRHKARICAIVAGSMIAVIWFRSLASLGVTVY